MHSDTPPDLIDVGANLTHESFAGDLAQVLARARAAGVGRLIVTGADIASSRAAASLAAREAGLFATCGVHPHHAAEFDSAMLQALREALARPAVVAVGETGLDFYRDFSPRPRQERSFVEHLRLAAETGLPVFLHERDAWPRFAAILREHLPDISRAVVHCFTGAAAALVDYLELGCYIGITGWICDERRGRHLLELVHQIPSDRLLLETDAPYLLPRDLKPKPKHRRNEPAFLPHILAAVARARGEAPAELAAATTANAERFFALPPV